MADLPFSALFVAACNVGIRQGVEGRALHKYSGPDGLHIVLNSTEAEAEHLKPVHMAIFSRAGAAFPIAVLNPYGGAFIANPDWTEDALIAALDAYSPNEEVAPSHNAGEGNG